MKRIVVGLSGGVDSAVAAYLLQQQGYEVIGVTICMHEGALQEARDAAEVAKRLSIRHVILDQTCEFRAGIIRYFCDAYLRGETPNPCVVCNPTMKWPALLSEADRQMAGEVATGHYAGVTRLPNGRYTIRCAHSVARDQAYVLYRLSQEALSRTRMPLADMEKEQVREIAESLALPVAKKADSMEICFLPKGEDYQEYIAKNCGQAIPTGRFVDEDGNVLGTHRGIPYYTVGQRKGLSIAFSEPRYVKSLNAETGDIILSSNDALLEKRVYAKDYAGMAEERLREGVWYLAKLRYSHKGALCTVTYQGDKLVCEFDQPQRAPTPGQSIVFFREGEIAGGAVITRAESC